MWDRREALHQSRLVETPTAYNPLTHQALTHLGTHGVTGLKGYGVIMSGLINQAYLLASLDLFWISAWLSLAMLGIVWMARRTYAGGHVAAGAD